MFICSYQINITIFEDVLKFVLDTQIMTYCFVKMQHLVMFVGVLQEKVDDNENVNTAIILVHKLVSVLESIEKVPVLLYDSPGSCYGLQVSSKIYRTIPSFTLPNVLEVHYYKY